MEQQPEVVAALFERARRHRISMAAICSEAKIDPTTPSRWKRGKNGATVEKLAALNSALDAILSQEARAA